MRVGRTEERCGESVFSRMLFMIKAADTRDEDVDFCLLFGAF